MAAFLDGRVLELKRFSSDPQLLWVVPDDLGFLQGRMCDAWGF